MSVLKENMRGKAEQAIEDLLFCFGVSTTIRPGMKETPSRVIKMLEEVWQGEAYTNEQLAEMYGKTFDSKSGDMVVVKDIEAFSYCEHHLALIYDMKISVGYIPRGKVIGLSKICRVADMCCKRLQLQERIGQDILDVMTRIVGDDVIVRIEASHSCMTARGIKKPSSKTVTIATSGVFKGYGKQHQFLQQID